jgi:hypothetical protein
LDCPARLTMTRVAKGEKVSSPVVMRDCAAPHRLARRLRQRTGPAN